MKAAFQLVGAGPAASAFLLVRRDRPRAGDAADRAIAAVVERVVRNLVDRDVRPDPLLVPAGERVDLPDAVALRPDHRRSVRAARGLITADAAEPGGGGVRGLVGR